jgi:hypothetical protein
MVKWRNIKGYENCYKVSELGQIYSIKSNKILKQQKQVNGYLYVSLCKDGSVKPHRVHRLVVENFIDNTKNKPQVNHIDSDRTNNNLNNLEWVTVSENLSHAFKYGKLRPPKPFLGKFGADHNKSKYFWIKDLSGNIKYYNSGLEFYRETKLDHTTISYARKNIAKNNLTKYVFKKGKVKGMILYIENPFFTLNLLRTVK